MPFDPAKPAANTPLDANEVRENFTSLKALIDAQSAQTTALGMQVATLTTSLTTVQGQITSITAQLSALANVVPIGAVIAWFKDTPGVPAIPANFVECNGQFLSDPESPLDGQLIPDINVGAERFIRGGLTSSNYGGIDHFSTAQGDNAGYGSPINFVTVDFSPGAQPFPPYITAVFIMRVK